MSRIGQPGALEEFATGSIAAFLGTGAVATWNRDRPSAAQVPVVVPDVPVRASERAVERRSAVVPSAVPARQYGWKLSERSERNLLGVHEDMVRLVRLALTYSPRDFGVTEGVRDPIRQQKLVAEGKSWTLNSRHLHGMAVDIVAYVDAQVTWDIAVYAEIEQAFRRASDELGVRYVWGGTWKTRDAVHFELDREQYPDPLATLA